MRTDADQQRRNARYPACGRADRKTAGPRSIACDAALSDRMANCATTARALQKCSRNTPSQSAEDCTAHRNSTLESRIVTQRIDSYIIALWKRDDDVAEISQSTTD